MIWILLCIIFYLGLHEAYTEGYKQALNDASKITDELIAKRKNNDPLHKL